MDVPIFSLAESQPYRANPGTFMPIELIEPETEPSPEAQYILVTDENLEVLHSVVGWENGKEMRKTAALIRKAGGHVTIFKATKY